MGVHVLLFQATCNSNIDDQAYAATRQVADENSNTKVIRCPKWLEPG
jgi:hypothetical protein